MAICDMDYNISVFDVDNLFKKKEEKISPGVCKFILNQSKNLEIRL